MAMQVEEPSRQTLEETPGRVLIMLRALGTSVVIRSTMAANGYTPKDHAEGWSLLHKASGFRAEQSNVTENVEAREAIAAIDATDEPLFRRMHAALGRLHPEQDAFVFDALSAQTGTASVVAMETFLDRLDALENGSERKATRKADHAALATLEARGLTKDERKRLRDLIAVAQGTDMPEGSPVNDAKGSEERREDLIALRKWFVDWSETARAVIKRRDHLIRLGLAKRKKTPKGPPSGGGGGAGG